MVIHNILIGGKAGQGINKISEIITQVLTKYGYFIFNYRDYPSLIRGGHNFNVISVSDKKIGSNPTKFDFIIALDDNTVKIHKKQLNIAGSILNYKQFETLGRDSNIALVASLLKIFGIPKKEIISEVKKLKTKSSLNALEDGYNSQENKISLKKLNNNLKLMSGSEGIALGAKNSKLDFYIAYPMTPASGVMHELANSGNKPSLFQSENEIAVVNSALGCSFSGKSTMIGTSGGGFDLMAEGLSLQGQSEIPLTVYLAARPGPATGVPTYTAQSDLNIALRSGHGEFPRVVIAPGNSKECIEKTNEAIHLAEKFNTLSIVLSDKHIAESQFSFDTKIDPILKVPLNRKIPGKSIVRSNGYEHDANGNTIESAKLVEIGAKRRISNYKKIQKYCNKFQMVKIYGPKKSKNLVVGWGSTKSVILDSIKGLDVKFLQVLYLKPMSKEIKKYIESSKNVILVENNSTGQLGRAIREKTGIKIDNKILRYDGRPFNRDELKLKIEKMLK
ncbi:hypothetical protein HON86_00265 [Candidatus Woesearchaeota archaeon]|mgnify:CR=1 FL=1|jgi:2-oxoglutarate ferredoxin oxidoreductase subunit alpha|nr:hypothetical protein [Candidatus Woesearchaeota archaeon]MBT4835040.1 hypothetical protein [Candidatus Woesearchaeota archaeon]MBT6735341.1 hypothetical protein [Candidatus Woesearchaeota archaeon]MBT7169675.1 hypothetical protein [Candidatus Woesearchaeota archaeon]MBT7474899.1 hypothetical protein [Candidatus Woesearchaeota archaeon]